MTRLLLVAAALVAMIACAGVGAVVTCGVLLGHAGEKVVAVPPRATPQHAPPRT